MSEGAQRVDARRRRERGAIDYMAALVMLFIAVPVIALAVDVGRLAWNRRQLQEVADIAALDAMRAFGQCREESGDPVAAAQASAVRNGYDGNLALAPNQVQIGSVSTVSGVRQFTAGGEAATATAVRVLATREVPFTLIANAILPGQARLQAEAVAARSVMGRLSAGSFAARFDTSDSPLWDDVVPQLLGGDFSLSAVSYQGLADAHLTLGELVAAANVASLEQLLALELTAPEYLSLLADALSDGGDASAAATLESIAGAVDAGLTLMIGDILEVAAGTSDAALEAQLNALDMLAIGAQVARGDAAISINPLGITVPGVATATAQVRIVQAPKIAFGYPGKNASGDWNTTARTGQVRMAITLGLTAGLGLLGNQPVALRLFVEAAQTEAHLAAIDCADASDPIHRAVVAAEPGLVRLGIGEYPDFENSPDPVATKLVDLKLTVFPLGSITVAEITGFADVPFQSAGVDLHFDGPFVPQIDEPSEDNTQTIGAPLGDALANALDTLLADTTLTVVPIPLLPTLTISQQNSALAGLTSSLTPVLAGLDAPLGSLFDTLGISLGGADITILAIGTKAPDSDQWHMPEQPALAR